ncbi:hypothetical protein CYMTET_33758 [Cymbomonas tetramitiformis]|uniref:Uncharacterized protein n=1 Tax=Cymbomonas tetramitiformis TaxID=36881 RepID=A0AAE0FD09_9CHLO|nr:hypothetical protein CYMTET_33758 [Cymbomonas tetramitiformis]
MIGLAMVSRSIINRIYHNNDAILKATERECKLIEPEGGKVDHIYMGVNRKRKLVHEWQAPEDRVEEFGLVYFNCLPGTNVSFHFTIGMTNLGRYNLRDHLPAGEANLPILYGSAGTLYFAAILAWLSFSTEACFRGPKKWLTLGSSKNGARVHQITGALLLLKTLACLTLAGKFLVISSTGVSQGWTLDLVLRFLRGVLFTVIMVIAVLGWLAFQPDLPLFEKVVISLVVPIQLVACSLKWVLDEEHLSAQGSERPLAVLHTIDIVCFFAILVPISRVIRSARHSDNPNITECPSNKEVDHTKE